MRLIRVPDKRLYYFDVPRSQKLQKNGIANNAESNFLHGVGISLIK